MRIFRAACVNYYGSTETQRAVSYHEIPPGTPPCAATVPVGQESARGLSRRAAIWRASAKSVKSTCEVRHHLARGYLEDQALTEARFLTNPLTRQKRDRLYQTGDLGIYLCDGNVGPR